MGYILFIAVLAVCDWVGCSSDLTIRPRARPLERPTLRARFGLVRRLLIKPRQAQSGYG